MKLREAITKAQERGIKWNPNGWFRTRYESDGEVVKHCCLMSAAAMGCDPNLRYIEGGYDVRAALGMVDMDEASSILDPIIRANDHLVEKLMDEWLDRNPSPDSTATTFVEWVNKRDKEYQRIKSMSLTEVMNILSERSSKIRTILEETEVCTNETA